MGDAQEYRPFDGMRGMALDVMAERWFGMPMRKEGETDEHLRARMNEAVALGCDKPRDRLDRGRLS